MSLIGDLYKKYRPVIANDASKVADFFTGIPTVARASADALISRQYQPQIDANNAAQRALDNQLMQAHQRTNKPLPSVYGQGMSNLEGNVINRPLTTPQEARQGFTSLAGLATMGLSAAPKGLQAARPLVKLAGYGALRGAENAAPGLAVNLATGNPIKDTLKQAGGNFLAGAAFNTVLSPKLVSGAVNDIRGGLRVKAPVPTEVPLPTPKVADSRPLVSVPSAPITKEKSFTVGARTSPDLSPEVQKLQQATDARYTPRKNVELASTAAAQVDKMGLDAAKQSAMNANDITDEGTARAIEVATRLSAAGQAGEANQILNVNAERALQAGRAGQANRLLARQTSLGMKAQLAQMAVNKGKTIPDEVMNKVGDMMNAALQQPEGRARNLAIQKVNETIQQQFPSSLIDQAMTTIQAGLLTGLKTSGFNEVANTGNALIKKVADAPATAVDAGLSLLTGKRTKTFTFKGIGQGAWDGSKEALDYLISGYDPGKVGSKYEGGTVFSSNKVGQFLRNYTDTVYRFMGSQDRPFSKAAFFNSIADQAGAEAKNMGLKGQDYTDHIQKALQNPSSEMGQRAAHEADIAVFANATVPGKIGKAIQDAPFGKSVVPFAKTPSAVVATTFAYTPVGALYEAGKQIATKTFDQRALADAIGKATTGTALLWLGTQMAKAGMITTSFPTDPKNVALWTAQNKKENSINFPGGVQVPASAFGPASALLVTGAAMQEAKDTGKDPVSVLPAQIGNIALGTPALQGVQNITNAAKDPVRYGSSWENTMVGETIPTLSGDIAQALDRAPNGQGNARQTNNIFDAVTNKIPFARQTNPLSLTTFGDQRTTGKNLFQTVLDPTRSSTMNVADPLLNELQRLSGTQNASMPGKQDSSIQAFGQKLNLTPDQVDALTKSTGGAIKQKFQDIINSPFYSQLPDDQKAKLLQDAASSLRTQGNKGAVLGENTQTTQADPNALPGTVTKDQVDAAKYLVASGKKDQIQVGDTIIVADPTSDTGYKQYSEKQIKSDIQNQTYKIQLDAATRAKDYKTWLALQQAQLLNLQDTNKALNPTLDQAKILANQNTIADIQTQIGKYQGYGGSFTKPKKAKQVRAPKPNFSFAQSKIKAPRITQPKVKSQKIKLAKNTIKQPSKT